MDEDGALKLVETVVERVMARQHPGRPAFYALEQAKSAVRRARIDLQPTREDLLGDRPYR